MGTCHPRHCIVLLDFTVHKYLYGKIHIQQRNFLIMDTCHPWHCIEKILLYISMFLGKIHLQQRLFLIMDTCHPRHCIVLLEFTVPKYVYQESIPDLCTLTYLAVHKYLNGKIHLQQRLFLIMDTCHARHCIVLLDFTVPKYVYATEVIPYNGHLSPQALHCTIRLYCT